MDRSLLLVRVEGHRHNEPEADSWTFYMDCGGNLELERDGEQSLDNHASFAK